MNYFFELCVALSYGLQYTVGLFFITALLSLPLGFGLTFMRNSKFVVFRGFASFYVWIMRGTPLLLQLFFIYFGLPFIPVIGEYMILDRFPAACVAFVLNYAAYFCEIFRGGLLSIGKGQYEAAKVLGLSKAQTTTKIVIPQMLKVTLPSISNECITLVKDTALITAIGVTEIMFYAKGVVNRDVNAAAYGVAALFYLIMNFALSKLFDKLEKKYCY